MGRIPLLLIAGIVLTMLYGAPLHAVTALVGDIDGFGFDPDGLVAAKGVPADVDGDGMIEPDEFLPDLDQNGRVAVGGGDSFDNRSAEEQAATNGAQFTDRAMEGRSASDGATFVFRFEPPQPGDPNHGAPHFINFVLGDFDVVPASISVDGTVIELLVQNGRGDGSVQMAFAEVPFSQLEDGEVVIMMIAPNEPYLAFDYALLDMEPIQVGEGEPPVFYSGAPYGCGAAFTVNAGDTLTFFIDGEDPDAGQAVTLDAAGIPAGAVISPALPLVANPFETEFAWTPVDADEGVHTIHFTAIDPMAKFAACTASIEVIANHPPQVANPVADAEVTSGESAAIDLTNLFLDPDDDPLTLSVSSSHPAAAAVEIDGSALILRVGALGTATITVTADDGRGGEARHEFDITVVPVEVGLDIKVGSASNPINLRSRGKVPVALLGSTDFDVSMVDAKTLRFGPAGAEPRRGKFSLTDANMDGFVDLVTGFRVRDSGLAHGDSEACLTGLTRDGVHIEGCDAVRIH